MPTDVDIARETMKLILPLFHVTEGGELEASLPMAAGAFRGESLEILVAPEFGSGRTALTEYEEALLVEIVENLQTILPKVETALDQYAAQGGVYDRANTKAPCIYLEDGRETQDTWAFTLEHADQTGYGWHVEFQGQEVKDVWAGD